jgi:hypothetical protein
MKTMAPYLGATAMAHFGDRMKLSMLNVEAAVEQKAQREYTVLGQKFYFYIICSSWVSQCTRLRILFLRIAYAKVTR